MGKPLRVLLVEDSLEDAELLSRALRRGGYEPTIDRVDTEDDLRAALMEGSWDLAICDWSLPTFSAPRAIETLTAAAFEGPILIVSGTMGEEHAVEAMRLGADDYVVKDNLARLPPAIERELREATIRVAARRAEGRLAVSESRLRNLVETIPATTYIAVASGSKSGYDTTYISPQINQMIGYAPDELVNDPDLWYEILHPEDRDAALRVEAVHLDTGVSLRHEYRLIARDGRVVWVRDEAAMLPGEVGQPGFSQGFLSDITEFKKNEETLRRQALIFENVHDAVIVVNLEGHILDFNPGAESLFGYPKEEALGRTPDFLGDTALTATILSTVEREGRWAGETTVVRKDGARLTAELVVVPLKDRAGRVLGTVGVLRDVTDRKRTDEELRFNNELLRAADEERRQLVSRLVAAREEEAQRIAGEIHDDPIQKLSAVGLRLGMLERETDEGKRSRSIAQIQKTVGDTIGRLRAMLFELSPRTLETGGLSDALKEYLLYADPEDGSRYAIQDDLTLRLSLETRTIAYRVALEALSNVRKHAHAANVLITLSDREGGVYCSVIDDGNGIAPEELDVTLPGHMGIASMRERVGIGGGWVTISGPLGQGTTIEFWLPSNRST